MPMKMKSRAEDIRSYVFEPTDELLLDANIWLFVYGPGKPGDWRVAVYSRALDKILRAKSRIYIDVLIVSEFINAYARIKYHIQCLDPSTRPHFKQFRQSADFKSVAQDVAADVRRVLQHCTRVESGFAALDINALIAEYEKGDSDFNDQILADLCKSKGLKLVTDDRDFKDRDLTVVTANRHLLAR
jgi:predicted nucleic acid-binding protein